MSSTPQTPRDTTSGTHWSVLGTAAIVLFVASFAAVTRKAVERRKLPPGPRGLPVLGNALQLPLTFVERSLFEWGKKYGDIVFFEIFGTPAIVLNSIDAARDLLDKRSSIYSARPRMVMLSEMLQAPTLPGIPYGSARFRRQRKWLNDAVGSKATLRGYHDTQYREVHRLLVNLFRQPALFSDHIHLFLAAIMLEITYGRSVQSLDDELVRLAERAMDGTNEAGRPGAVPVDFFPLLQHIPGWMPGAGFKRHAMVVRDHIKAYVDKGYDTVKSDTAAGTAAPCIFGSVLAEYDGKPTPVEAEDIKGLAFDVYAAGVETSRSTLMLFLLAMTRNGDALQKAQEEIDRVVGRDRLPDFNDRDSMPYTNALLEEVYRWNPALPMAIPHCTTEHDEYRGYEIPAGCMVIPNTWAMTRDAKYYPEPEDFRPERHLPGSELHGGSERLLPSSFVFGFGRRVCPGQNFADSNVWLAIVNIVALFDIRKAVDDAGNEISTPAKFLPGFTSQPAPFVCRIVPRSASAVEILATLEG